MKNIFVSFGFVLVVFGFMDRVLHHPLVDPNTYVGDPYSDFPVDVSTSYPPFQEAHRQKVQNILQFGLLPFGCLKMQIFLKNLMERKINQL